MTDSNTYPPRKDDFKTDSAKDAWQKGFNVYETYRGPPTRIMERMQTLTVDATGGRHLTFIHPQSKEILEELHEALPQELHRALMAGYLSAVIAAGKQ